MDAPITADALYSHFPANPDRPAFEAVLPEAIPEPYRSLLVHTHHMTVTVERFYASSVDVRVLEVARQGENYARKIVLALAEGGPVVQFGLVAVDLAALAGPVREQIEEGRTPLGRVLIEHDVLRHIEPAGYLRVQPSAKLCEWLEMAKPETLYGRLGVIHADGRPAVGVLEILAPVR